MPRPRKRRLVRGQPAAAFYKPQGTPLKDLQGVVIGVDGLEALRLADMEGLDQGEAAELMGVSRSTFCRILARAREAVARALVMGWAIRIEGGHYRLVSATEPARPDGPGPHGGGRGRGRRGWRNRS